MREELEGMIREKGLGWRVRLLGAQSQPRVMDLCFSADVIVAPLSGTSLVEAALSGSPVVTYDVEWHSELIRHPEPTYSCRTGMSKGWQRLSSGCWLIPRRP